MPTETPKAIVSPLSENAEKWEADLKGHLDKEFMGYIVEGLRHGFWIGCDCVKHRCIPLSSWRVERGSGFETRYRSTSLHREYQFTPRTVYC